MNSYEIVKRAIKFNRPERVQWMLESFKKHGGYHGI